MQKDIRLESEMNLMISSNKKKWKRMVRQNLSIFKEKGANYIVKFQGKRPILDVVDPFEINKRPKINLGDSFNEDRILKEAAMQPCQLP